MSDQRPLSHLEEDGGSRMVNVGSKALSLRTAEAEAIVRYPKEAFHKILAGEVPKGGIVEPARVAGILAAKRTADLIPMCHALSLDWVQIAIDPCEHGESALKVRCRASLEGKTGVEMEAMVGAAVAALTLYAMTKALATGIVVENVRVLEKTGGKSGTWRAQ